MRDSSPSERSDGYRARRRWGHCGRVQPSEYCAVSFCLLEPATAERTLTVCNGLGKTIHAQVDSNGQGSSEGVGQSQHWTALSLDSERFLGCLLVSGLRQLIMP